MSKMDKLKEIIRELIKKELDEASTSAATPGYQTPYAFSGGRKKGKKKKKEISTNSTGYNVVKEALNETPQMAKQGQVGLLLKLANKQLQDVFSLHKKGKNKEAKVVFNNKVYSTLEYIHRAFDNVSESVKEGKNHQAIIRLTKDANVLKKLISAVRSKNFEEIADIGYKLESLGSKLASFAEDAKKAGE